MEISRRKFLKSGAFGSLVALSGCIFPEDEDVDPGEAQPQRQPDLPEGDSIEFNFVPEENYTFLSEDRVLIEESGREMNIVRWAEENVMSDQIDDRFTDHLEAETTVPIDDPNINISLKPPQEPMSRPDVIEELDYEDISTYYIEVQHISIETSDGDSLTEANVSFDTILSELPRYIDVTILVSGREDYQTILPIVATNMDVTDLEN